LDVIKGNYK